MHPAGDIMKISETNITIHTFEDVRHGIPMVDRHIICHKVHITVQRGERTWTGHAWSNKAFVPGTGTSTCIDWRFVGPGEFPKSGTLHAKSALTGECMGREMDRRAGLIL